MFHKLGISFLALIFSCLTFTHVGSAVESDTSSVDTTPDAMQHQVQAPFIDFENLRDPFTSYLATLALRGQLLLQDKHSKLANREREPLEEFDLSTLHLVGVFSMGEKRVAMIQDNTGQGHSISQGNYMGKNNGRVEKIDGDTVYLIEQGLNPAGEIIDKQVTLTLKEINQ